MQRLLSPTLDVVFKVLFADPGNRDLLVSLLEAVLRPPAPISDITIENPELPNELVDDRGARLDLLVRLRDGRRVNVEMQSYAAPGIPQRALFYWAGMYRSQLRRGDEFTQLAPCVSVIILVHRELPGTRYHSTFRLLEVHDQGLFSPALELHALELPKLPRRKPRRGKPTVLHWGRFLAAKNAEELEELAMTHPAMRKAKDALEFLSAQPDVQELARRREEALLTYRHALGLAGKRGRAEGLREAVLVASELLGIELDAQRRSRIDNLESEDLERLLTALRRDRCWPSE
jgi:predicted transposase/invertase (TIGR01784 family)